MRKLKEFIGIWGFDRGYIAVERINLDEKWNKLLVLSTAETSGSLTCWEFLD